MGPVERQNVTQLADSVFKHSTSLSQVLICIKMLLLQKLMLSNAKKKGESRF